MSTHAIGLRSCLLMGTLILVSGGGARAGIVALSAHLSGPEGGSGDAALVLDDTSGDLVSAVTFDLADSYTLADAVITEGKNGPVIHTLATSAATGLTQGSFADIWTGLTATDIQALETQGAWITIHTAQSPTGDISGQIVVPEPPALVSAGIGAAALLGVGWLRHRRSRPESDLSGRPVRP